MLGARLRKILGSRGISINEYAEICELPLETVRNIYYGKTTDPKVSTVLKMANALNMSVNCLMGEYENNPEEKILNYYRTCGNHGKSLILLTAKYEATAAKAERNSSEKHKIPCLLPNGELNKGIAYDNCEIVDIETTIKDAFVSVKITSNDFAPVFCKGDILLLANRFPENGEYAFFYIGDRAFLRKFIEENGQYKLQCIHNIGKEFIMKRVELEYIGTYCGVVRT